MSEPILVSACLVGLRSRYDGQSKADLRILDFFTRQGLVPVPVCPEQLSGLPTPRPSARFIKGSGRKILTAEGEIRDRNGHRLNEAFIRGAEETFKIAELTGCKAALLKERSPSCGVHCVYLEDQIVPGQGVTTALLLEKGLDIFNEEELENLINSLNL